MENFSETKKGGRPRLIRSRELRKVVDFATGNPSASERTRQNKFYQLNALRVLGVGMGPDAPAAYHWIWPPGDEQTGKHRAKWTILAELGRIADEEILRGNAAYICAQKMKTAAAMLEMCETRVRELIRDGELNVIRPTARTVRAPLSEIRRYTEAQSDRFRGLRSTHFQSRRLRRWPRKETASAGRSKTAAAGSFA